MTITPRRVGHRERFAPDTVTAPLLIESGAVTIDAEGVYDAETGDLLHIALSATNEAECWDVWFALKLLRADYPGWRAPLSADRLDELVAEAIENHAAAEADRKNDERAME